MRNVVLWVGMSLDGFTSGENERLDWLVPHATQPEAHEVFQRLRERADTILLGRVNYEGFLGYWPQVKDDPKASPNDKAISRWLDDTEKVVFSQTLREVTWKNARLARPRCRRRGRGAETRRREGHHHSEQHPPRPEPTRSRSGRRARDRGRARRAREGARPLCGSPAPDRARTR